MFIPIWLVLIFLFLVPGGMRAALAVVLFILGTGLFLGLLCGAVYFTVYMVQFLK